MKLSFRSLFFFTYIIISHDLSARELNYLESQLFRLSSYERNEEWVLPFYRYHKNSFPRFRFTTFFAMTPKVPEIIDDIESKNQKRIESRIDTMFGKPYDANAKVSLGFQYQKFTQTFSLNHSATVIVNDPVFPELEMLYIQDEVATTSYIYTFKKGYIIPRLIYGRRKILDSSLSAIELANNKSIDRIEKHNWIGFVDFSVSSQYRFNYFDVIAEINSLPLSNQKYNYWNSNIGVKSKNLSNHIDFINIKKLDAFAFYSPFYGGNYGVSKTIKFGIGAELDDWILLDIFTDANFLIGAISKFNFKYFTLSAFTYEYTYDEYLNQTTRQYGLSITGQY